MLTSFFGKSSPLNFLLVCGYVALIASIAFGLNYDGEIDGVVIGLVSIGLIFVFLSVFTLDFMVKKNGLTLINSFTIFFFGCFLAAFPAWTEQLHFVVAGVCLLFAMRRIYSLQSPKKSEIKTLDATMWIALAALFYVWSILMLVVLYFAIYLKPHKSIRYYLIPIAGLFGAAMMSIACYVIAPNMFLGLKEGLSMDLTNFSSYAPMKTIVAISILGAVFVWALGYRVYKFGTTPKKDKPNYLITLGFWLISLFMAVIASEKSTAELLLVFPSAAIVMAGFMEHTSEKWFKELVLWLCLLLPAGLFFI
jgi:hypothetical protein